MSVDRENLCGSFQVRTYIAAHFIESVGVKPAESQPLPGTVNFVKSLIEARQGAALIAGDHHPGGLIALEGVPEPVKVAVHLDQFPVFLHEADLSADKIKFLLRQKVEIQLISECAKICHIGSCLQRCRAKKLVVGHCRDMRSHAHDRIYIGSAVLDLLPLVRVGIVAAPGLGRPEKHSRVKSGAAARAALKKNVRELTGQLLIERIDPKNIAVHHLSLAYCRPCAVLSFRPLRRAERTCHIAVHIPLDIRDPGLSEDLGDHFIDIVHDIRIGIVKDILVAGVAVKAIRRSDDPLGMAAVKVAVLVHHLQFYP